MYWFKIVLGWPLVLFNDHDQLILNLLEWYYFLVLRIMVLTNKIIHSSQLTTSIHWPWYCTVYTYVVIDLCDSAWSILVAVNLCRFLLSFVYICIVVGSNNQEPEGWDIINRFNTATYSCLFHTGPGCSMWCVVIFLCSVIWGERRLLVLLISVELLTITV
jgi:hypothetical protein